MFAEAFGEKRSQLKTPPPETPPADNQWPGPIVKFDLPRGNAVEIRLRQKLSPEDFKQLKRIFDLSELAFVDENSVDDGGGDD
jgi:hypothetical protein